MTLARPTTTGAGLTVACAVVVAIAIAVDLAAPQTAVGAAAYLTVTGGAALVAWLGVRRHPPADRPRWRWIALGLTLSALGDAVFDVFMLGFHQLPDVSVADVFYLASYPAIAIGLLAVAPMRDREGRVDVSSLLELLAVLTVGLLVVWNFAISPTLPAGSVSITAQGVWIAYPLLDAVLLVLVARTLSAPAGRWPGARPLALGAACWLVADLAPLMFGSLTGWPDAGWMIGSALLAWSVWRRPGKLTEVPRVGESDRVPRWRVAGGLLPLVVPAALAVISYLRGESGNPFLSLAAMAVLGGLFFVHACRSLTQAETARQRLLASELYYRTLAANSSDAVVLVGADGRILTDSPKLAELVGHAGNPTTGIKITLLVEGEDVGIVEDLLAHALAAPGVVFDNAVRVHHGAGGRRWIAARVINLLHDPAVGGIVANLRDVTDRKSAEERLAHQAYHDSLTGLANRTLFLQRVEQALRRDVPDGSGSAVIFLDVDGFKTVNDSLGHEAGDQMLCEVAARLVRAVRGGDTVARLGGDEFAVLAERSAQPGADAASIAERILDVLGEPMVVDGLQISISASLGIAVSEPDSTASALLRSADIAMYQAKSQGKKRWVAYRPEMQVAAVERLQLEADLSAAVDTEQLRLVYQPVVDLETNRVAGLEALLRWDHPTLGTIAPARFIPIAEESGLIVPIGRRVLDTACEMAVEWQRFAPPGEAVTMAVNMSGCQLASGELIDDVRAALARSGLPADRLLLEMTETVLVRDAGNVAQQLRELRQLGVRLAIDDFGTGYSSLSYLRTFPVDMLKLDRSFVSSVGDRTGLPAIVSGLLDLARTLGLEIVAEGIERPAQRNLLRDAHCPLGQGFLFARPLRPDDVAGYLAQASASIRPAGMELADAN